MTFSSSVPRSTIPNVPEGKIVNEDGTISELFKLFLVQLINYMQTNLSNEGLVNPPLTTAEIALLTNALNGTIVYNSTTNKLMGKENGTFTNII